jgi:hypothetical protein
MSGRWPGPLGDRDGMFEHHLVGASAADGDDAAAHDLLVRQVDIDRVGCRHPGSIRLVHVDSMMCANPVEVHDS